MNIKQRILKILYPVISSSAKIFGTHNKLLVNKEKVMPFTPLYELGYTSINGKQVSLNDFSGRYMLIVNTASNCGYTAQLASLEELNKTYRDKLVIIGFPSNDFNEQEKGSEEEIQQFCTVNFGVNFPLSKKITVRKNSDQHIIYSWLTDASQNGWNDTAPSWNFSKYLVDPNGVLIAYADAAIEPAALIEFIHRTG